MDTEANEKAAVVKEAKATDDLLETEEWKQAEASNFGRNTTATGPITPSTNPATGTEVTGLPAGTNYGMGF